MLKRLIVMAIHVQTKHDSLAEWSKALASGASPQGRGFEPHSCHLIICDANQDWSPGARELSRAPRINFCGALALRAKQT